MQVCGLVADHGGVHVLGAGCLAQGAAGLGAPPAHGACFGVGQVGQAGRVTAWFYEEMPQVNGAAGAAWRGWCQVRDDDQLVLAYRAAGQQRPLLPVLAVHEALCGAGHGCHPRTGNHLPAAPLPAVGPSAGMRTRPTMVPEPHVKPPAAPPTAAAAGRIRPGTTGAWAARRTGPSVQRLVEKRWNRHGDRAERPRRRIGGPVGGEDRRCQ
jgi:hypothetical protein